MDRYDDDLLGSDESSSETFLDRAQTDDQGSRRRRASKAALIASTSISALLIDKAIALQSDVPSNFTAASELPGGASYELRDDGLLEVTTTSGRVVLLDAGAFVITADGALFIAKDAAASAGLNGQDALPAQEPETEDAPIPDAGDVETAADPVEAEAIEDLAAEISASDLPGLAQYELREDGLLEIETTAGRVVLLDAAAFTLTDDGELLIASEAAVSSGLNMTDTMPTHMSSTEDALWVDGMEDGGRDWLPFAIAGAIAAGGLGIYFLTNDDDDDSSDSDETPTNNTPAFGSVTTFTIDEGGFAAFVASATDDDGDALTYSLSGTDASLFTINATTGLVRFIDRTDFEIPADANSDNQYSLTVSVSDGTATTSQAVTVTVQDVDMFSVAGTDDNDSIDLSSQDEDITIGAQAGDDAIITDAGDDTVFAGTGNDIIFAGQGADTVQAGAGDDIIVLVGETGTDEYAAGSITNSGGEGIDVSSVLSLLRLNGQTTSDAVAGETLVGGVGDDTLIVYGEIDLTEVTLSGIERLVLNSDATVDAEDLGAGGVEVITGTGSAVLRLAGSGEVDLADLDLEGIAFLEIGENVELSAETVEDLLDAGITAIGGSGSLDINTVSGDDLDGLIFEESIEVSSDGESVDPTEFGGSITDGSIGEVVLSVVDDVTIDENTTALQTVSAIDAEGGDPTFTLGGQDAALFNIDEETGAISFIAAPDFETPSDTDVDNVYRLSVRASVDDRSTTEDLIVRVSDVNEAPTITSGLAGSATENSTATDYQAGGEDPEGLALSYSIAGGDDGGLFTIDENNGTLAFVDAPDFENPTDADGDGTYEVAIEITDGELTSTVNVSVTVNDTNEAPSFTSPSDVDVAENAVATGLDPSTTDPDGDDVTVSITGGADAGLFEIGDDGIVFVAAPDFETPADADGNNVYEIELTASDGDVTVTQDVTIAVTDVDENLPEAGSTVSFALANDTGREDDDAVSQDMGLTGVISNPGVVVSLVITLDGEEFDITDQIEDDGSFALTEDELATLLGEAVEDGTYLATLTLTDTEGLIDVESLTITRDTSAPGMPTIQLSKSSDSGELGDGETVYAVVNITGTSEAGASVQVGDASASIVGAANTFTVNGLALGLGENEFDVSATDRAGNIATDSFSVSRVDGEAGDPVLFWLDVTLDAIASNAMNAVQASRGLAMVSIAMSDAVSAIDGSTPFYGSFDVGDAATTDVAVGYAAYEVLNYLFPDDSVTFTTALNDALDGIDPGDSFDQGQALGEAVGDIVVAIRNADGWDDFETYTPGSEPGDWDRTGPFFSEPVDPQWATVDTFVLDSQDQFRPDGPPDLTSQEYAEAVAEVQSLGKSDSTTRTEDQSEIAQFWKNGAGTSSGPGQWNEILQEILEEQESGPAASAKALVALNVAMADAGIAAWDAKYTYGFWRPEDAIAEADTDGNDATVQDEDWRPLITAPAHPEYVSGHSTFSGAAATVLTDRYGDNFSFEATSRGLPGVTRSYSSFDEAAEEAGRSRIYGGIHYEFSNQDGLTLGDDVASEVLDVLGTEVDNFAPLVLLDGELLDALDALAPDDAGLFIGDDLTIGGRVVDNLSGVEGFVLSIDGGANRDVDFDQFGLFSVEIDVPDNDSFDGVHTYEFTATDLEGNVRSATIAVVVDTVAPTLSLESFADGDTIENGTRLSGTFDPTGSKLVSLTLSVDGADTRTVAFDQESQTFDEALPLGTLGAGEHTVTVVARDAAGNETSESFTFTLEDAIPFEVVSIEPAADSEEVGLTQNPKITFSRAVDPDTITEESVFIIDSAGEVVPASVVVGANGTAVQLFPDESFAGSETHTLVVKGDIVAAAADGALLDGDDDGEVGGDFGADFTTVSNTPVANTSLVGKVVGPGPDLEPMTDDDFSSGADGTANTSDDIYDFPIAGAKVYILGREDEAVFTDENGEFTLTNVPAGNVKVAVDGRTATNPPEGVFYPEMTMDLTIVAGQENTILGTTGTADQRLENLESPQVYLPRLSTNILQVVSEELPTEINLTEEGSDGLTEEEAGILGLTVQPGSLVDDNGDPVENPMVGISTVPPELVRDMLPDGVLQHTFDITIQAPDAAAFTEPAQITFPNVFNAEPGTKLNFLSFDHDTGRLVIEGTATVSADGSTVTTDADTGVTKPGWHGLTPPGGNGCSGGSPLQPDERDPDATETETTETLDLYTSDGAGGIRFVREWSAPDALPGTPPPAGDPDCPPPAEDLEDQEQPWVEVTIEVDEVLSKIAKKAGNLDLVDQSFVLRAGTGAERGFAFSMKSFVEMFGAGGIKNVEINELYGSKITITTRTQDADGDQTVHTEEIFVSRFIDAVDDKHTNSQWEFVDTVNDGAAGDVIRKNDIKIIGGDATPEISVQDGTNYFVTSTQDQVWFDPVQTGDDRTDQLEVSFANAGGDVAGSVELLGDAKDKQKIFIDRQSIIDTLKGIADGTDGNVTYSSASLNVTAAERALFDNLDAMGNVVDERGAIADAIIARVKADYNAYTDGVEFVTSGGTGVVTVNFLTSSANQIYGRADRVDTNNVDDVVKDFMKYSKSELYFRMDHEINQTDAGQVNVFLETYLEFWNVPTTADLVKSYADTTAHEAGHTLGLRHAWKSFNGGTTIKHAGVGANNGQTDIMMGHAGDRQAALSFDATDEAVMLLSNMEYTRSQAQEAFNYYYGHYFGANGDNSGFSVSHHVIEDGHVHDHSCACGQCLDFSEFVDSQGFELASSAYGHDTDSGCCACDVCQSVDMLNGTHQPHGAAPIVLSEDLIDNPLDAPVLGYFDADGAPIFGSLDFGSVIVTDDNTASITITITNVGTQTAVLDQFASTNGAFTITGAGNGTQIAAGESVDAVITFNPSSVGSVEGILNIEANDGEGLITFDLEGFGQSDGPHATLLSIDNNLGGADIDETVSSDEVFTIRNDGDEDLIISAITLGTDAIGFALSGIPDDLDTNPITLGIGETFSFGATFTGTDVGLARGSVQVVTNDTNSPTLNLGLLGTGFEGLHYFDWGNDFVAVEVNGQVTRVTSDSQGNFDVFLPPEAPYRIVIFDPESGLLAEGFGTTAPSGGGVDLTSSLVFRPDTSFDGDFDGLSSKAEFAIGTSDMMVDSNGDGISDFASIELGIDPLAGVLTEPGIVASLDVGAVINEIVVTADLPDTPLAALLAVGTNGLAVVGFDGAATSPILLNTLDLPGTAVDVALDDLLGLAAVATGQGVSIVDVTDVNAPTVINTINRSVNLVEAEDGRVYTAEAGQVVSYDLASGERLQRLDVPSGANSVRTMTMEGGFIYTVDSSRTLTIIEIVNDEMVVRGNLGLTSESWSSSIRSDKLFASDGVLYIPADQGFNAGYATVDITDPAAPSLISGPDDRALGGTDFADAGSGVGLAVGRVGGVFGIDTIMIVDTSDPEQTGNFSARFDLDNAAPNAVVAAGGFGFVGDSSGVFHVVNGLGFDVNGVPPQVNVDIAELDADPGTEGIQIEEGQTVRLPLTVSDDVQIQRVELLLDGEVVRTDLSIPYSLSFVVPTLASGATEGTVQVRAVDTGGNATTTAPINFTIIEDITPPEVVRVSPADNGFLLVDTATARVILDEAVDPASVTAGLASLTDGDDNVIVADSVQILSSGRILQFSFPSPAAGTYTFDIDLTGVTDLAGNAIGGSPISRTVELTEASATWDGESNNNRFETATNWRPDEVPTIDDVAFIGSDALSTVQSFSNVTIEGLRSEADVSVFGGIFTAQFIEMATDTTFTLEGGILRDANVIGGTLNLRGGTIDGVTVAGTGMVDTGRAIIARNLSVDGVLTVNGSFSTSWLQFTEPGTASGNGSIDLSGDGTANARVVFSGSNLSQSEVFTFAETLDLTGNGWIYASRSEDRMRILGDVVADGGTIDLLRVDQGGSELNLSSTDDGSVLVRQLFNARVVAQQDSNVVLRELIRDAIIDGPGNVQLQNADLDNVDIETDATIINFNEVYGGLTVNGVLGLDGSASVADLIFRGTQMVDGAGVIDLLGTSANNDIEFSGLQSFVQERLTFGPDITLRGHGSLSANNEDRIGFNGTTLEGVEGGTLSIQDITSGSSVTDRGVVNIDASAGRVEINDRVEFTAFQEAAGNGDGRLSIAGGTLVGSSLAIDAVVLGANTLTVFDSLELVGGATLELEDPGSSSARLYVYGSQIIGDGEIFLNASDANGPILWFFGEEAGRDELGIGEGVTVRGAGQIRESSFTAGDSIDIAGRVEAEGGELSIRRIGRVDGTLAADTDGVISIESSFTADETTTIEVSVDGTDAGLIEVTGTNFDRAGIFSVTVDPGATFQIGDTFTVVQVLGNSAEAFSGAFDGFEGFDLGNGLGFVLDTDQDTQTLSLRVASAADAEAFINGAGFVPDPIDPEVRQEQSTDVVDGLLDFVTLTSDAELFVGLSLSGTGILHDVVLGTRGLLDMSLTTRSVEIEDGLILDADLELQGTSSRTAYAYFSGEQIVSGTGDVVLSRANAVNDGVVNNRVQLQSQRQGREVLTFAEDVDLIGDGLVTVSDSQDRIAVLGAARGVGADSLTLFYIDNGGADLGVDTDNGAVRFGTYLENANLVEAGTGTSRATFNDSLDISNVSTEIDVLIESTANSFFDVYFFNGFSLDNADLTIAGSANGTAYTVFRGGQTIDGTGSIILSDENGIGTTLTNNRIRFDQLASDEVETFTVGEGIVITGTGRVDGSLGPDDRIDIQGSVIADDGELEFLFNLGETGGTFGATADGILEYRFDLELNDDAALSIGVDAAGAGLVQIINSGSMLIQNGTLALDVAAGATDALVLGDEFQIVTTSAGLAGSFDTLTGFDTAGAGGFALVEDGNNLFIRFVADADVGQVFTRDEVGAANDNGLPAALASAPAAFEVVDEVADLSAASNPSGEELPFDPANNGDLGELLAEGDDGSDSPIADGLQEPSVFDDAIELGA
ncbi:MAG: Ig-like domain-containing protein [Pseudomonadota bacterium]